MNKTTNSLRKLVYEEVRKVLAEEIYVGQTVKVKTPNMSHSNKVGEVVEQDAGGKFFTVEFSLPGNKTELAYYHKSDLKAVRPS